MHSKRRLVYCLILFDTLPTCALIQTYSILFLQLWDESATIFLVFFSYVSARSLGWCFSQAYIGTAHVDLEWIKPSKIGNEATKDAWQIHTEVIQKYVATLRVVEQHPEHEKGEEKEDSNLEELGKN